MKILKDNSKNRITNITDEYPKKLICEQCESELEYEESDIYVGDLGAAYVRCPICGCENLLEGDSHEIVLTEDNVKFPDHFFHYDGNGRTVDLFDEETIRGYIKKGIKWLRTHPDEYKWFISSGDMYLDITKCIDDEEYVVILCKDYYESYIPFGTKDFC